MAYSEPTWLKSKPPVGSPDRDPEKEYQSHEEWLDEYYDHTDDRLNDEKCDRAEREENRK